MAVVFQWNSSSNVGCIAMEVVFIPNNFPFWFGHLNSNLKSEKDLVLQWRLSSNRGHLHYNQFSILVVSFPLNFKI